MGLGFDWNGDGKDGMFDDLVTLHVLDGGKKKNGSGGKRPGGHGSCAVAVIQLPALLITAIFGKKDIQRI